MRFVSYESPLTRSRRVGVVMDGQVHGLRTEQSLLGILTQGANVVELGEKALTGPFETVDLGAVTLAAPIDRPPTVRDFMSFESHVVTSMAAIGRTVSPVWYESPVFYFSNPGAVLGPEDGVPVAPGSAEFDYELEIAAVIGRGGTDIPVSRAADHIAGYTLLCDWSARDLQEREMQVGLGPVKAKDTATTLGPYFVTPDELDHIRVGKGFDLRMQVSVNEQIYTKADASELYWSFEQMISYASRGTRVLPGDVIGSGTLGTGCILELSRVHGAAKYPWLRAGDTVTVDGGLLGSFSVPILPAHTVQPLT